MRKKNKKALQKWCLKFLRPMPKTGGRSLLRTSKPQKPTCYKPRKPHRKQLYRRRKKGEGNKAKAERTQKDLAEMVSKTPKAIQQKRRAELDSNIKTALAGFLQATKALLEAYLSEEER